MSTRRRIASMLALIGVLFLGARFFGSSDKLVPATIVYRVPPGTTRLEAEVFAPGTDTPLARFVSVVSTGPTELEQKTRLPPGTHELRITLTGPDGETQARRTIDVVRDARVTVDLVPTTR